MSSVGATHTDIKMDIHLKNCEYTALVDFNYKNVPMGIDEINVLRVQLNINDGGLMIDFPEKHFDLIEDEVLNFANQYVNDKDKS